MRNWQIRYIRYRINLYNSKFNNLLKLVKSNNKKVKEYSNKKTQFDKDMNKIRNIYNRINLLNSKIKWLDNEIKLNIPETKVALLIGLNYFESKNGRLNGCHYDVDNMKNKLLQFGFKPEKFLILKDNDKNNVRVTRRTVFNALYKLSKLKKGTIFIHFSGHGMSIRDNNHDEKDGYDESICLNNSEYIVDDDLFKIFNKFSKDVKIRCIFDCCHSGTIGDLRYNFDISNGNNNISGKQSNNDVIIISGCVDESCSYEVFNLNEKLRCSGGCTSSFIKHYKKNSSIGYLVRDMTNQLNLWRLPQHPQITSSKKLNFDSKFI